MVVLHYVSVDVLQDHAFDEMTCYIHHMKMTSLHYVFVYVSPDDSVHQMPCYTHHSKMAAVHYVQKSVHSLYSGKKIKDTY